MDDKSRKCFLGIRDESEARRLNDLVTKIVTNSKDVIFQEKESQDQTNWKLETQQEEIIYKDKNNTTVETTTIDVDTAENSEKGNSTHGRKVTMKEIKAIENNHTWELTSLSKGVTPIRVKWVF